MISQTSTILDDYGHFTAAWYGQDGPFLTSVVDVQARAGQTVRFAWRLGSDSNSGDEGWYIDDVRVNACFSTSIFTDSFESGSTSA